MGFYVCKPVGVKNHYVISRKRKYGESYTYKWSPALALAKKFHNQSEAQEWANDNPEVNAFVKSSFKQNKLNDADLKRSLREESRNFHYPRNSRYSDKEIS